MPGTAFQLIVLLFSVVIHEVAHGVVALRLGDETAKREGRLTLNPLKHLDLFGSVLLPLLLLVMRSPFLLGWAKPVPYNPRNLKNPRVGAGLIGIAGPASNLALAGTFALLIRALRGTALPNGPELTLLFAVIVWMNILLAFFNLVPIPPLDGSRILFALIGKRFPRLEGILTQYGFLLLVFFLFWGFGLLELLAGAVFRFFVGAAAP